jgi:hypothetical protein
MLSNKALKLPSPKPWSPLRWMNSKKIGPELVLAEDLQQQRAGLAVDQDLALAFSAATSSPCPGMRLSTSS